MKQRMAPIQRSVAKPPKSCLQNLIHSGVVFGGVSLLGPSRANTSSYFSCVNPCTRESEVRVNFHLSYLINSKTAHLANSANRLELKRHKNQFNEIALLGEMGALMKYLNI